MHKTLSFATSSSDVRPTGEPRISRRTCAIRDSPTPAVHSQACAACRGWTTRLHSRSRPYSHSTRLRCLQIILLHAPAGTRSTGTVHSHHRKPPARLSLDAAHDCQLRFTRPSSCDRSGTSTRSRHASEAADDPRTSHRVSLVPVDPNWPRPAGQPADRALGSPETRPVRCVFFRPLERRKLRFFRAWFSDAAPRGARRNCRSGNILDRNCPTARLWDD
jgi:hypothetical protein